MPDHLDEKYPQRLLRVFFVVPPGTRVCQLLAIFNVLRRGIKLKTIPIGFECSVASGRSNDKSNNTWHWLAVLIHDECTKQSQYRDCRKYYLLPVLNQSSVINRVSCRILKVSIGHSSLVMSFDGCFRHLHHSVSGTGEHVFIPREILNGRQRSLVCSDHCLDSGVLDVSAIRQGVYLGSGTFCIASLRARPVSFQLSLISVSG